MSSRVAQRLTELGIVLPTPPKPVASYVPWQIAGNILFVSGQGPVVDGKLKYTGIVGLDLSVQQGADAALLCGINVLAQVNAALSGNLDRVDHVVRLGGFVRCQADFTEQPQVINGASDLMLAVFGDAGRHARTAVGTNALPLGMAVEVEAQFALR